MADFRQFNQDYYSGETRAQRLRVRKKKRGRRVAFAFLIFSLLGLLGCSAFVHADDLWVTVANRYFKDRINTVRAAEPGKEPAQADKHLNILLIGNDQRKNEPARSDTLMVAMVNLPDKTINVISIPRDTRVKIEGLKYRTKINHALPNGGVELTRKTVEELLGIPIHNYVETNFEGFENIIDTLGGVDMNVEKRMYYPVEDIDLRKGWQHLDGHDALSYVRFRSDGKGDLPRIERQHKFLSALADEVLQPKTVIKLPKLVGEVLDNVRTDMSVQDLLVLTAEFKNMGSDRVMFSDVPGTPKYINDVSYYEVDEEKLHLLIEKILSGGDTKAAQEEGPETPAENKDDVLPGRDNI